MVDSIFAIEVDFRKGIDVQYFLERSAGMESVRNGW